MKKILFILLFIPQLIFSQVVNVGTAANDGTGDNLRTAFTKINNKFSGVDDSITVHRSVLTALYDSIADLRSQTTAVGDQTAPTVSETSTNSAGDLIFITMSENFNQDSLPGKSAFTLNIDGASVSIDTVQYSSNSIYIVPDETFYHGQLIYVSYIKPTASALQDLSGNEVASFLRKSITNNSTQNADTIAPIMTFNAIYNSNRNRIYYDINEPTTVTTAGWTLSADSGAVSITSVDSAGKYFSTSRDLKYGETVNINYSPFNGATVDTSGNELDSLSRNVNNYIQQSTSTSVADTLFVTERDATTGWIIIEWDSGENDSIAGDWSDVATMRWDDVEFYNTNEITVRYALPNTYRGWFSLWLSDPSSGQQITSGTYIEPDGTGADWDTFVDTTLTLTSSITGTYDIYFRSHWWDAVDLHYLIVNAESTGAIDSVDLGGDYYFSQSGNDVTGDGTQVSPWKSITKLNALIPLLQAGDSVFFKRGDVWYDSYLNISNISGTAANKIVFTAYGTGDDPVITGEEDVSGLFTQSGNFWTYTGLSYEKSQYVQNTSGLLIDGDFYNIAREPEQGNYYRNTGSGSYTTVIDNTQSWGSGELIDGVMNVYTDNYTLGTAIITNNSDVTVTYNTLPGNTDGSNPYFVSNYRNAADKDGEHWYDEDTLGVYYESNLNALTVGFPVRDLVVNMDNVSNVKFENITFRGSNIQLIDMDNSSATFDSCEFNMATTGIDVAYGAVNVTNSVFKNIHAMGIHINNQSDLTANYNQFKYIRYWEGLHNDYNATSSTSDDWGGAITLAHSGLCNMRYNTFDTVTMALQTHWAKDDWYFEYNKVDYYGATFSDVAAIYMGGDWQTDVTKVIKGNIILNSTFDRTRLVGDTTSNHPGVHPHGIYMDYSTKGILMEENTIYNTNVAFFSNRNGNNIIRNNKIIKASRDMYYPWATNIYWDNLIETESQSIADYTVTGNTFVFGNNSDEVAYTFHESATYPLDYSRFTINNNTYHDPFTFSGTGNKIAKKMNEYNPAGTYSLSNIGMVNGDFDTNSTFNSFDWNYEDVTGISRANFVKVLYNFSSTTQSISIGDAYDWYDLDGNTHTGTVSIPAWGTKILLFKNL